jgi:hypothetical protein
MLHSPKELRDATKALVNQHIAEILEQKSVLTEKDILKVFNILEDIKPKVEYLGTLTFAPTIVNKSLSYRAVAELLAADGPCGSSSRYTWLKENWTNLTELWEMCQSHLQPALNDAIQAALMKKKEDESDREKLMLLI